MFGYPPGAVGARKSEGLWQPVPTDNNGSDAPIEEFGDIEAWRPEASMPGCSVGWLAGWLAGWLTGWLAWLAGLASWLGWPGGWLAWLAGCSWRVAAG